MVVGKPLLEAKVWEAPALSHLALSTVSLGHFKKERTWCSRALSPQKPPTSPGDSPNFRKKRREVRCHAWASTNFSWLPGSGEGGQSRKEGFVVGESHRAHPSPETWGWRGPAQLTGDSQLRGGPGRPANPTPFLWAPRGPGGFVYESSSLLPQPGPPPALRVVLVAWEGETGPPTPLPLPFLPPASPVDERGGQVLFPVLLCLSC